MKKVLLFITILGILTGCSSRTKNTVQMDIYESYYQSISETTKFTEESRFYTLSAEITQTKDGKYSYYIVLDQPHIAMYDVVMMAVENHISYDASVKMMPSIGIFDEPCNLVPNQINVDNGYAEGIVISGESQDPQVSLNLLVEWKDQSEKKTSRLFHSIRIDADGLHFVEESAVG